MKQVTINNVKARIAELEGADQLIGLGLHAEFELACLRRMLELEARCAALAAENAGLKQFPDQIVGFIGKLGSSEIGSETKEKIEAAAKKIKTPATDAFLAEVRAQGAEMFAAYCGEENSVFVEAKAYYRSLPDAAYEFAAQLRQEAAQ